MAKLKIPSLQHLARNWRDEPDRIKWQLVNLAKNAPTFNYNPLYGAARDLLIFGQSLSEIEKGIRQRVKRSQVRDNYLEVLPLMDSHFAGVAPDFVQAVERRYYAAGRGLMVPFEPPLLYGLKGEIQFPWFSFWRSNPLSGDRLSLFVTLVDDVLKQDPDLEGAHFSILDFSVPVSGKERELRVADAADIRRVGQSEKAEMLRIFAEGYYLAEAELNREAPKGDPDKPSDSPNNPDQPNFFD